MQTYDSLLAAVVAQQGGRPITDPATDDVVGYAPEHTAEHLERSIDAARAAQPAWAALGHGERARLLNEAADAVDASANALAQLITREQGKPLSGPGSRFEASAVSTWLRAAATTPLETEQLPTGDTANATLSYQPVGLVGAIGPWNWPAMIATWQFAPALRMGNAVIMKPSEYTPLSVLAVAAIVNQVLPVDVFTVLAGDRDMGATLTQHSAFGKLMFTGSIRTGKAIVQASAEQLPRLTLELGGNDPGIVLPDVDPDAIAEDLFWGAFINTGQTCACLKRLYVHESVYDAVVEALANIAAKMPTGPGTDEHNSLGPLTTKQQFGIVDDLVKQATDSGARVVTGADPDREASGNFYPTTLIADIDPDQPLVVEEQFGPALPIVKYTELEDAITQANALEVGLGASVWSADPQRGREVAARIQSGTVWINQHGTLHPRVPFGGVKGSGYGLEFGVDGLKAVALPQVISG